MTTYATLQTDVAAWLARTDLTAQIPSFIRLCENEIRRVVRVLEMQVDATLTIPDTGQLALPADFLGFRHVAGSGVPDAEINYVSPDRFHELRINRSAFSGVIPKSFYTIESGNIILQPAPGSGETVDLDTSYFQAFPILTAPTDTNWLLTNHFDIYLYGSIRAAYEFIRNRELEDHYHTKFALMVKELHRSENRKMRSGGPKERRSVFAP